MHTTGLRSQDFAITVAGETATLDDVFPGFDGHDRLAIVIHDQFGAAGAGSLILAAVTAFYDHLRATGEPFFAYADYFAFHVGADHGTLRKLDVYPAHKEVVVPDEGEPILQAINDRGVTRLLVPDGPAVADRPEPAWQRETLHSAQRRIRTALVYSPTGHTPGADVVVRGSAQSDGYIAAMLGNPQGEAREPQPAQTFRRTDPDQALSLLLTPRG
ncbi:MAG TPA: hypothetical protein VNV17_16170 [Solirubrobacteraceae bacterium]|jgi:hypothetical protein|nr:hypothetical protein [Solirubrobacteraceae bacterium]